MSKLVDHDNCIPEQQHYENDIEDTNNINTSCPEDEHIVQPTSTNLTTSSSPRNTSPSESEEIPSVSEEDSNTNDPTHEADVDKIAESLPEDEIKNAQLKKLSEDTDALDGNKIIDETDLSEKDSFNSGIENKSFPFEDESFLEGNSSSLQEV